MQRDHFTKDDIDKVTNVAGSLMIRWAITGLMWGLVIGFGIGVMVQVT